MRVTTETGFLRLRAISGTRVVLLAIDIAEQARDGLLGFAIARLENGEPVWLQGRKVFASVEPNPDPAESYPSNRYPIQSLIWSDFNAAPGQDITYRVHPVYGPVAAVTLGDAAEITITTIDPTAGAHGIYFNFGAVASQAFAETFHNQKPQDEDDPADREVQWLSRGALQAALDFIAKAADGDSLRVAAYEFTYTPILKALRAAAARGVDVRIVHEAGTELDEKTHTQVPTSATTTAKNAIERLGLANQPNLRLIKRTRRRNIPHNKFIVWLRGGEAVEVLAGSANFTASGFIGQTNVVHIVRNRDVAQDYLDYWTELSKDPTTPELSTWTQAKTPQDDLDALTAPPGITTFFSPRKNDVMLAWYADQIAAATGTVMFTAAFGVNKLLAAQFGIDRPFVRFILLEDEPDKLLKAKMAQDRDVVAAYGSILGDYAKSKKAFPPSSLDAWFLKEELFRKQGYVFFIHTKFLLIDPLGDNPLVCTGSANFSTSSLEANDENMLLIRGDTDVADVYLTEFDRIFRHFYARQVIDRLAAEGRPLTEAKFLDESDGWLGEYTQPGRLKTNRQRLFFPSWPGR